MRTAAGITENKMLEWKTCILKWKRMENLCFYSIVIWTSAHLMELGILRWLSWVGKRSETFLWKYFLVRFSFSHDSLARSVHFWGFWCLGSVGRSLSDFIHSQTSLKPIEFMEIQIWEIRSDITVFQWLLPFEVPSNVSHSLPGYQKPQKWAALAKLSLWEENCE